MDSLPPAVENYTDQSQSAVHHVLRASRRRLVIGLVAHRTISPDFPTGGGSAAQHPPSAASEGVSVRQLAKEVVAIEEGIPTKQATGDDYHNVYTALIQTHLPELDDIGAIAYDGDRKTVEPDRNLLVLSMVAAITSPVVQMLFHTAVAEVYSGETSSLRRSHST
jgi:hypothetical protein